MCDMRGPPIKLIDLETKEEKRPTYHGCADPYDKTKIFQEGVYTVGASGCGYSYFSGTDWHSCYSDNRYKFEFQESQFSQYLNYSLPAITSNYTESIYYYVTPKIWHKHYTFDGTGDFNYLHMAGT